MSEVSWAIDFQQIASSGRPADAPASGQLYDVKIADFGLSKAAATKLTASLQVLPGVKA